MIVDALGNPAHFMLTGGQVHDSKAAVDLLSGVQISGSNILGDKAYGAKGLERYLEEEEGLRVYRVFLEEIQRKKAHTLSGDRERILARAFELGSAPGRIYVMFQNAGN